MRNVALLLIVAILAFCPSHAAERTAIVSSMTPEEERNLDTIRKLLLGFAEGNVDQIDSLVHENFVNHHAPVGLQDREGFKQIVRTVHAAFASFDEFTLEPVHLFAKGRYVAMMDTGRGTRDGRVYRHVDIHIFIMEDGKLLEHWNSFGLPSQREILQGFLRDSQ